MPSGCSLIKQMPFKFKVTWMESQCVPGPTTIADCNLIRFGQILNSALKLQHFWSFHGDYLEDSQLASFPWGRQRKASTGAINPKL